jgi:hypothetical protein
MACPATTLSNHYEKRGVRIFRVLGPTRAIVSRAEITLRVMLRSALFTLPLSLPQALSGH